MIHIRTRPLAAEAFCVADMITDGYRRWYLVTFAKQVTFSLLELLQEREVVEGGWKGENLTLTANDFL
jgi:hypothetical protein